MGIETAAGPAGPGEIPVVLDGRPYVLRPSLRAAKSVNFQFKGFFAAHQRLAAWDLGAFIQIAAAGLGAKDSEQLEEVEQLVYATGLTTLLQPLSDFVESLANGGRPPADKAKPEGQDRGNG